MNYQEFFFNMSQVSPDGSLYSSLVARMQAFYFAVARTQITEDPSVINAYKNLANEIKIANDRLMAHKPPLAELPTEKHDIGILVQNIVEELAKRGVDKRKS